MLNTLHHDISQEIKFEHKSKQLCVYSSVDRNVYLRNKFHFAEVHRSMNATGHERSK